MMPYDTATNKRVCMVIRWPGKSNYETDRQTELQMTTGPWKGVLGVVGWERGSQIVVCGHTRQLVPAKGARAQRKERRVDRAEDRW